jgi:hypothetical protein
MGTTRSNELALPRQNRSSKAEAVKHAEGTEMLSKKPGDNASLSDYIETLRREYGLNATIGTGSNHFLRRTINQ